MDEKKKTDFNVTDFDVGVKKAIKGVASNSSLIMAALTIIVGFMVFFTDLDGGFKITASFSPSLILLVCLCLVEYSSTKQMGAIDGKNEKSYQEAVEKHKSVSRECQAKCTIRGIMDFCTEYAEQELIKCRSIILKQVDMSYAEYAEKYIGRSKKELPKDLSKHVRKCIAKANKLKPMHISQDNLLFKEESQKYSRLTLSPRKKDRIKDITSLSPMLISIFFAAHVAMEMIANPTFATFAECMIKVVFIVRSGTKGYSNGYYNIVDTHVNCMEASASLLQECMAWKEKDNGKNETQDS